VNKNLSIIWFLGLLRKFMRCFRRRDKSIPVENIDHFKSNSPKTKRALISLSPAAWSTALREFPNIKIFNVNGLTYIMVKVLNENGYIVDIVDYEHGNFTPTKRYDIFIGHGGRRASLIDILEKNNTVILQYVSQAYWKEFLRQSTERYERVCMQKKIPLIASHVRSHSDQERKGEEYLAEHAKYFFTANCPRMIKGYGKYAHKIHAVGWAAYVEDDLIVNDRDFDKGRKGFIYVAGTKGSIQKGFDLILEAFACTPDLDLYIYCDVDKEVRALYRKELSLPNIRYIYHYRFGLPREHLRTILKRVNFTITAPIDTGIGTAFLASLGLGLIPVGYADMPCSPANSHLADSWQVESLVNNIREASQMPVEWCRQASASSMQNFRDNWSPQAFEKKFSEFIRYVETSSARL
jgi:hypothetical protein